MKKRVLAVLVTAIMIVTMMPVLAFAEEAVQAEEDVQMVGVTIGVGNGGDNAICTVTYEDGTDFVLDFESWVDTSCEVGKKLCEGLEIAAMSDPEVNGDCSPFLGWTVYEPGAGPDGEPLEIAAQISTEELMNYIVPAHNIMIEAMWDEEAISGAEGDDGEWAGPVLFAVSGNGGKITIKDELNEFNGKVESYNGEFLAQDTVKNAVSFKIASAEKDGAVLTGWTVYEAERIEMAPVKASIAEENGGAPPFGDPNLEFFLYDVYEEDGVKMHTYIGLWYSKIIDKSMSTEDLYNLGGNDKSYYAVANWAAGTTKELTVNGQAAILEIADDITAVDSNLKGKFETVEQIKDALSEKAFADDSGFKKDTAKIEYMDIVLKVKNKDGIWEVATPENFPEEGIEVVIPYPDGTDKNGFMFSVLHMFAHGNKAGSIEVLEPEIKDDGLHVTVYSLSPFAIAYQEAPEEVKGDSSPATGDDFNLIIPALMMFASAATCAALFRRRKA